MSDPHDTQVLGDLGTLIPLDRARRRDPLKGSLLASSFALACLAGCWAIWTHREWIRACDAVVVVIAVAEFARLFFDRRF